MFGRMMNNYYYGKSGKGDYRKEDLPKNRWQLFWEMLRVRFSSLCRLNLMTILVWLPLIAIFVSFFATAIDNTNKSYIFNHYYDTGMIVEPLTQEDIDLVTKDFVKLREDYPEYAEYTDKALMAELQSQNLLSELQRMLVLLIPAILITGPIQAGVAYVTRNWSRDEHAFIWSDFKDAVKENWKQGLGISTISSLIPILVYTSYTFYGNLAETKGNLLFVVPQMLIVTLSVVWYLSCTFMYPLMVSYNMKFKDLVKNGMMLAIARLPHTVVIRLAALIPSLLLLGIAFVVSGNAVFYALLALLAYYVMMGFSISRFIFASFTNGVFDKYINSHIEGVKVNRGIASEDEDEDEEEEETDGIE